MHARMYAAHAYVRACPGLTRGAFHVNMRILHGLHMTYAVVTVVTVGTYTQVIDHGGRQHMYAVGAWKLAHSIMQLSQ